MAPELIFYIGIFICCIAVMGAIIAIIFLHLFKVRLDKQLDAEYGKRRH
ncbi:MAG: hypothetical protein FWG34_00555 [Oscillospiraceae bacterium]|nr:hypothetical protein [Oscillospiraceae bacterium]